jgi:hypothetical protein
LIDIWLHRSCDGDNVWCHEAGSNAVLHNFRICALYQIGVKISHLNY